MHKLLILTVFIHCVSCVQIPQEAPILSKELGERITAIETSNIKLLSTYFQLRRDNIDKFIEEEWTTIFAENFFNNNKIDVVWQKIVASGNTKERLKFITIVGPKLQKDINNKRLALIKPLDELERKILIKLKNEFNQARAINNSITSFLLSASKVAENRDRYLEKINISNEDIGEAIEKTDEFLNEVFKVNSKLTKTADKINDYQKRLKDYKLKMKNLKNKLFN